MNFACLAIVRRSFSSFMISSTCVVAGLISLDPTSKTPDLTEFRSKSLKGVSLGVLATSHSVGWVIVSHGPLQSGHYCLGIQPPEGGSFSCPPPRNRLRLHPAPQRRQEAGANAGAGRELSPHEAGQGLLQGEVHRVAGPRAGADPRKNGRGFERLDDLPVTSLNVGLQRQNDGLSSQTTQHVDNRTLVETSLRQPLGALREVSYQLFKATRSCGLGLRAAGRQALRGPAAGGAAAAAPERGALRLRRHLRPRLAGRSGASRPRRSASSASGGARRCCSSRP